MWRLLGLGFGERDEKEESESAENMFVWGFGERERAGLVRSGWFVTEDFTHVGKWLDKIIGS